MHILPEHSPPAIARVVFEKDGRLPQAGVTASFDVAVQNAVTGIDRRCVRIDLTGRPATRKGGCG